MKRRFLPIVAAAVLVGASVLAAGEPRPGRDIRNYYPLEAGNSWTFRVDVNGKEVTATSRIAKIEKINDISMGRLEVTVNDKIVGTEHLQQNDKGVFRHRLNGLEVEPPLELLRYPVKAGEKWAGELKVGADTGKFSAEAGEETIEVAAGKYKTVRVAIQLIEKGKTIDTTYWFAKDVGIVKQTVVTEGLKLVMELERFDRKK